LRKQYESILQQIRDKNPAHDLIIRPAVFTLKQIQDEVIADSDTTLLEYSLGEDASYVWAVTKSEVRVFTLQNEATITAAVSDLYAHLSSTPEKEETVEQLQRKLSDLVLAPLNGQVAGHRLVIVSDGSLNYIPFQSLTYNNQPLIQNYEVINAPSASVLAQLHHEQMSRPVPEHILAAFGDSVFQTNLSQFANSNSPDLVARQSEENPWQHTLRDLELKEDSLDPVVVQPLFYSKVEIANLRRLAGDQAFVATGFDSSRDVLQGTDLSKYAILHLATHGFFDPKRPERSGLLLSIYDRNLRPTNGFVSIQDIYNLRAPVDLVVLSACRTGLGRDVRGEGLIGLTRGFMHAGASSVVATLWKVDDEATAELMKRFYTAMLQHGMTPAAALRFAQNEIRSEPRWKSPYYWAAFTIQGDYQQNIRTSARRAAFPWAKIAFGTGIALLILSATILSLRRRRTA
jgi:CHAT domain-containing protein